MSITQFSQLTGIKRKAVIEYLTRRYPLFIIGKDKLDLKMALVVSKTLRSQTACLD